ncbi:MAG: 30S ribosomal protein S12 methylthiotransferase RimO [Oscillospiraceae bacterium]|nr:30S ribosomal protein S12 methylthiotransferase RimO [Oscillospiraceae bacterium]
MLNVGVVSLGCDKNRVDSEIILGKLKNKYSMVQNPEEADIIIVNTCGFIQSAKAESINTILEMAELKKDRCKLLVVTGCLSARYGNELLKTLPEVDIMLGVNNYDILMDIIDKFFKSEERIILNDYSDSNINFGERILTTNKSTAYIRIAEGCDNNCTYCVIPKIRGKYRSRKIEDILSEAKNLCENGIRELILIAQDTTYYGKDIYNENSLSDLLHELSNIEKLKWIRVLYCYPEEITIALIDEMKTNEKICHYLDIPLQHISNRILKSMGRKSTKQRIEQLMQYIKYEIPDIVIRTSLIVGFPGESEEDVEELKDFLKRYRIQNVGVFKYSNEEGAASSNMKNQIPFKIKEQREKEIMMLQSKISLNLNKAYVGKIMEVLIEGKNNDYYFGRNEYMIPEVDGKVLIRSKENLEFGKFYKVKILKSLNYDLIGDVEHELS